MYRGIVSRKGNEAAARKAAGCFLSFLVFLRRLDKTDSARVAALCLVPSTVLPNEMRNTNIMASLFWDYSLHLRRIVHVLLEICGFLVQQYQVAKEATFPQTPVDREQMLPVDWKPPPPRRHCSIEFVARPFPIAARLLATHEAMDGSSTSATKSTSWSC